MISQLGADMTLKLATLVYQIWLLVGPGYTYVRAFVLNTFSINTDLGTESYFANARDVLRNLFVLFGDRASYPPSPNETRLFPNALQIAGWKHVFDNLIQKLLLKLKWFPEWLRIFKASDVHELVVHTIQTSFK